MNINPLSRRGFLKAMAPLLSITSFLGMNRRRAEASSGSIQRTHPLPNKANAIAAFHASDGERINVQNYGFLPTATPAVNSTALQAAWQAARSENLDIFIPAGVYLINPDPGVTLLADWDVEVLGAGKQRTQIRCDPAVTLNTNFAFMMVSPGNKLTVEEITLEGPGSISGDLDGRNAPVCTGIHHQGNFGGVTLRKVAMRKWGNAVLMDYANTSDPNYSAGGELRVYSSDFRGRKSSVVCREGNTNNTSLYALDCTFGLDPDCFIGAQLEFMALQLDGGVSFDLNDCTFVSTNKYGLRVDPANNFYVSKKAVVNNCNFLRESNGGGSVRGGSGINTGIFARTSGHPLIVRGGSFHSTVGISIGGDTIIEGVQFFGYGTRDADGVQHGRGAAVIDDDGAEGNVTVIGCAINAGSDFVEGDNIGYNCGIRRQFAKPLEPTGWGRNNAVWLLCNNTFGHAEGSAIRVEQGQVVIKENVFNVGHPPRLDKAVVGSSIYLIGGATIVAGNKFMERGDGGAMAIFAQPYTESINLTLQDNEFLVERSYVQLLDSGANTISVRGRGNRAYEPRPGVGLLVDQNAANRQVSGELRFGEGHGVLEFATGKLLVNANYDTYVHRASGGPAYDNIEVQGPVISPQNAELFHGSPIRLIASTAFTLNHNTGAEHSKLLLRGAGSKTVAAAEAVTLMYDRSCQAWIEV